MFEGLDEQRYRQATKGHASAAGAMLLTFWCRGCNSCRATAGRKMRVKGEPRLGYLCSGCVEKRGKGNV